MDLYLWLALPESSTLSLLVKVGKNFATEPWNKSERGAMRTRKRGRESKRGENEKNG